MKFTSNFLKKKAQGAGGPGGGYFSNSPIQRGKPSEQDTASIDKYLKALQAAPETEGTVLTPVGEQGTQGHQAPWQVYHDYPLSRKPWKTYDPAKDPGLMNNPNRRHYGLPLSSEKMRMVGKKVLAMMRTGKGTCPDCGTGLTQRKDNKGEVRDVCTKCEYLGKKKSAALPEDAKELIIQHLEGKSPEEILETIDQYAPGALRQWVHNYYGDIGQHVSSIKKIRRIASAQPYGLKWQEASEDGQTVTKQKWFPSTELREGFEHKLKTKDSFDKVLGHTGASKTARLFTEKEARDWYSAFHEPDGGKILQDKHCPLCGHTPIFQEPPSRNAPHPYFCHACSRGFDQPKEGEGTREEMIVREPDGTVVGSLKDFLKGAASKPKCPHCGSSKYSLMPSDFETAKCDECGKTWDHGIVPGVNDPSEKNSSLQGDHSRMKLTAAFLQRRKVAGATTFSTVSEGKTAEEAYQKAVSRATSERGTDQYNGTISTTRGFRMLTPPPGVKPQKWVEWVMNFHPGQENKDWRPVEFKDGQKCPATNIYQGAGKPPIKKCKGTIIAPPGQWPKCSEGHGLPTHGQGGKFYYDKPYPIKSEYLAQIERDSQVAEKWGPCACVQLGGGKFLFFGWAAE